MISSATDKQLSIMLPNTNKALEEVLKEATPKELASLSQGKDLSAILRNILTQSTQESRQNQQLLSLLKENPTLKSLGSITTTIEELKELLTSDKQALPNTKALESTLSSMQSMDEKELKRKIENSGLFLESKLKSALNSTQANAEAKDIGSSDLKALLLQAKEELQNATHPNKQELLKQIEKLSLTIDYYQLSSHLSNSSTLYVPYSWDALEEGNIRLKKGKKSAYFCDIELELKEYGLLELRLGLFDKNQLNINIKTQSQNLQELILEKIPTLKKQLLSVGITPKEIRFLQEQKERTPYTESAETLAMGFEIKA